MQKREFGNYFPSPDFKVTKNNKVGVNANVLNLVTGIEGRLSYIRANQGAQLPEPNILGEAPQKADMLYLGLSAPLTPRLTARLTQLIQHQHIECWSALNPGYWCNLKVVQKKSATAIELAHRVTAVDLLSFGLSQTTFDTARDFFCMMAFMCRTSPSTLKPANSVQLGDTTGEQGFSAFFSSFKPSKKTALTTNTFHPMAKPWA